MFLICCNNCDFNFLFSLIFIQTAVLNIDLISIHHGGTVIFMFQINKPLYYFKTMLIFIFNTSECSFLVRNNFCRLSNEEYFHTIIFNTINEYEKTIVTSQW